MCGGGGGLEIPDFAALPQLDQCLGRIEDILWCAEDGQSKSRPCGGMGVRNSRLCCLTTAVWAG